ncbi:MAG: D-alanyl-D-alanine carboxypeptidase/D-alanyl-D-alanine-endopeptidase [Chitinophagaceae bacterium]|nr:D-alanyl-D-alanine carboxypeptidase/D-alanyl-D-alanine-endopeptidase [Chitinophagaceae bacterium]
MKKVVLFLTGLFFISAILSAQTVTQKLQRAWQQFESDPQLKHAISSLYVIDAKTGAVVFDKNSQIGLAPASTQKIITATTAFELLGKDYKYETKLGYTGELANGQLNGDIVITASGDPSLGSWRWQSTSENTVLNRFTKNITSAGIKSIKGDIKILDRNWSSQQTPDGWIAQDIGNYYGAGPLALNWRENQFDVYLRSGTKIGDPVEIVGYRPALQHSAYTSEVTSAARGSGDNAYIYQNPNIIRGTIPAGENKFEISGSMQNAPEEFVSALYGALSEKDISIDKAKNGNKSVEPDNVKEIYTYHSPSLDSLIYWFLKKSINLYGEALVKTFAYQEKGFGSTDAGVEIIKDFWKQKGIDEDEINIGDGSGLSPQNRVTTHAQVEILKYAKKRDWFPYFFDGLPDYNGMKMKSGTIRDVKGFCGYHKADSGKEYIFSFLVNNYNGRTSGVVSKMYKVLDVLK